MEPDLTFSHKACITENIHPQQAPVMKHFPLERTWSVLAVTKLSIQLTSQLV